MQMIFPGRGTGGPIPALARDSTDSPRQRFDSCGVLDDRVMNLPHLWQPLVVEVEPGAGTTAEASTATEKFSTDSSPGNSAPARGADVGAVLGVNVISRMATSGASAPPFGIARVTADRFDYALDVVGRLPRTGECRGTSSSDL